MKNAINNFIRNAGKIWKTLNIYGTLSKNILITKTKLKQNYFYVGIGWIARENKIQVSTGKNIKYKLN